MSREKTPFISVGIDVGADFSELSVALPTYELVGKPYKLIHSDPKSLQGAVERIRAIERRESLQAKIFLESTGIYHYPLFTTSRKWDMQSMSSILSSRTQTRTLRNL